MWPLELVSICYRLVLIYYITHSSPITNHRNFPMKTVYCPNYILQYYHQANHLEVKAFVYSIINGRVIKSPWCSINIMCQPSGYISFCQKPVRVEREKVLLWIGFITQHSPCIFTEILCGSVNKKAFYFFRLSIY